MLLTALTSAARTNMQFQLPQQAAAAASPHAAAVIGPGRVGRALSRMSLPPAPLYGRDSVLPKHLQVSRGATAATTRQALVHPHAGLVVLLVCDAPC
jgi:hypothetical protein